MSFQPPAILNHLLSLFAPQSASLLFFPFLCDFLFCCFYFASFCFASFSRFPHPLCLFPPVAADNLAAHFIDLCLSISRSVTHAARSGACCFNSLMMEITVGAQPETQAHSHCKQTAPGSG
ncbi:hypothetical protein ATANTOWER_023389 [Ataeniobius toweri]|uniref:Secreted protein n=1 Tax=Ataeniobius toweri TaxID=208326 RepID=A0ABU7CI62_9TELE|nr:hypothetical protein [Ataeniobius toweri]